MLQKLKHIAEIRFGLYARPKNKGAVQYLQARQFDNNGNLVCPADMFINEDTKISSHLLIDGDVLLAGKGFRNFAWRYGEDTGPAVASSMFFVLRPDKKVIDSGYLTTLLNMKKSRLYFEQLGAGTNINSIRKNELGEFPVPVLPLEQQIKVNNLSRLYTTEVQLLDQYKKLAEDRHESILNHLIK